MRTPVVVRLSTYCTSTLISYVPARAKVNTPSSHDPKLEPVLRVVTSSRGPIVAPLPQVNVFEIAARVQLFSTILLHSIVPASRVVAVILVEEIVGAVRDVIVADAAFMLEGARAPHVTPASTVAPDTVSEPAVRAPSTVADDRVLDVLVIEFAVSVVAVTAASDEAPSTSSVDNAHAPRLHAPAVSPANVLAPVTASVPPIVQLPVTASAEPIEVSPVISPVPAT